MVPEEARTLPLEDESAAVLRPSAKPRRFVLAARGQHVWRKALLHGAEADVVAVQPVLRRADVAAADHGLSCAKLAPRDEPQRSAAGAGHDGHKRVLRMTQLGLVFQHENRSRVHSFGNPFLKKL